MQAYLKDIVIHILNIIALFVMLRLILYKPVKSFMDQRSEKIAAQLKKAEEGSKKADELNAEYDKKLAETKEQCSLLLAEANKKAKQEAAAVLEEANEKAAQILRTAREEANKEKQAAIKQAKGEITEISLAIARKILKREVTLADNEEVIEEYFKREVCV